MWLLSNDELVVVFQSRIDVSSGNNGGMPTPDLDTIDIEHLPESPTDVQVFFGIDDPVESCAIDWNIMTFATRIAKELIPIACDSFGNLICISLSSNDHGSVVYCNLNPRSNSYVTNSVIYYRLAPDFDRFLEKIRSLESN